MRKQSPTTPRNQNTQKKKKKETSVTWALGLVDKGQALCFYVPRDAFARSTAGTASSGRCGLIAGLMHYGPLLTVVRRDKCCAAGNNQWPATPTPCPQVQTLQHHGTFLISLFLSLSPSFSIFLSLYWERKIRPAYE